MLYLWLKYIHVVSSTILFGTGMGTASVMLYGHYKQTNMVRAAINRYVVMADWVFTTPAGIVQPLTGLAMVWVVGYSFTTLWVMGSIIGYIIAGCCWFPVVYLQMKMRDMSIMAASTNSELPKKYYTYFKIWFCLGWPAFISLIIVFYFMTVKPI